MGEAQTRRDALAWFSVVLQTERHNIVRWPDVLWQQLDNRIRASDRVPADISATAGIAREKRRRRGDSWLALDAPPKGINEFSVSIKLSPLDPLFEEEAGWQRRTLAILCCAALGDRIAVGANDGSLRLLRAHDLRLMAEVQAHKDRVMAVCSIADGARFVSAGQDGGVCVWDVRTLSKLMTLETGQGHIVAGAGAKSLFATGGSDGTAIVWNGISGEKVAVFPVRKPDASACLPVALSSDGKYLAAGEYDGGLSVWSVEDARRLGVVDTGQKSIQACAFARENRIILSCGAGGKVVAWDWSSSSPPSIMASMGRFYLSGLSVDPISDQVVFGDENGNLWSHPLSEEGEPHRITTHSGEVYASCIAEDAVFSGGRGGVFRRSRLIRRDDPSGRETGHDTAISCCAVSAEKGWMATGEGYAMLSRHAWIPEARRPADRPLVKVWTTTGTLVCQLSGHLGKLTGCCFSPDGVHLAATDTEGQIVIWSVSSATQVLRSQSENAVCSPAFSADSRWFAVRGNGRILVYDLHAPVIDLSEAGAIARLGRDRQSMNSYCVSHAFSPDKSILACAIQDDILARGGHVELWREPWKEASARSKAVEDTNFTSLAWSPDGSTLIGGTEEGSLLSFDPGNLALVDRFRAHSAALSSCAFAARGDILFSASEEGSVRAWTWPGGRPAALLPTQGAATCVAAGKEASGCAGDGSGAVYLFRLVREARDSA